MKLWACEIMGLDSISDSRRSDAKGVSLAPPAARHCLMRKRSGLSPKGECFPFGGSVMEMTRREFAKGGLATFGGCACLHVGERKPATVACKVSKFGVLRVERLRLGFEGGEVDASQVSLNFIEVKPPVDGVLADEVDFILTLPVPPSADVCIGGILAELPEEVALERVAGKGIEVACRESLEFPEAAEFDHGLVAVDEAEPKAEEAVVDTVVAVFVPGLLEYGACLGHYGVVALKLCEIAADVDAKECAELGECRFPCRRISFEESFRHCWQMCS